MEQNEVPAIYASLAAVKADISKSGIEKASRNKEQGYYYRGIDNVMDGFASTLAANKILVCPVYSKAVLREGTTKAGGVMHYWSTEVVLTFLSLIDGSTVTVGPFLGEAMDTQDKGQTKAQSVAYRVGMLLTFTCPLGPEADPEASDEAETSSGIEQWAKSIAEATSKEALDSIAAELKEAQGIPERDLRNIRGLWAARIKEVAVQEKQA